MHGHCKNKSPDVPGNTDRKGRLQTSLSLSSTGQVSISKPIKAAPVIPIPIPDEADVAAVKAATCMWVAADIQAFRAVECPQLVNLLQEVANVSAKHAVTGASPIDVKTLLPSRKATKAETMKTAAEVKHATRERLEDLMAAGGALAVTTDLWEESHTRRSFLAEFLRPPSGNATEGGTPADALEKELRLYHVMNVSAEDGNMCFMNPLTWWRSFQGNFPHLWAVVKMIYAVPCSSAASERAFSQAKQIFPTRRALLDGSTAEALMRLRSGFRADKAAAARQAKCTDKATKHALCIIECPMKRRRC